MVCPKCISHNPEGAESCHWCGNTLRQGQEVAPDEIVSACVTCGSRVKPADSFCSQCGMNFLEILEPELEQPVGMPGQGMQEVDYPTEILHGEQMEPDWERKGFLIRLVAWAIDQIPIYIAYVLWGLVIPQLEGVAYSIGMVVIYTVYYVSFTAIWGKTPGKMLLGLRVVDSEGNTPTFYRVLLRETVGKWLSAIPLFLGFLSISWDEKHQGWYDRMAKTYVVGKQKAHTHTRDALPNSREGQPASSTVSEEDDFDVVAIAKTIVQFAPMVTGGKALSHAEALLVKQVLEEFQKKSDDTSASAALSYFNQTAVSWKVLTGSATNRDMAIFAVYQFLNMYKAWKNLK